MEALKTFKKAVFAGVAIGIGATAYLACQNKAVGAFLFSLGLFYICTAGLNLFTGRIGYVIETKNRPNCFIIWLGNYFGCAVTAALMRIAKPELSDTAHALLESKLALTVPQTFVLGAFCGALMYIAVNNFKENPSDLGKYLGIFLCVPAFIMSGFEHSVANMFYLSLGGSTIGEAFRSFGFIVLVSVANSVGATVLRHFVK